jgi:hypothetical protein
VESAQKDPLIVRPMANSGEPTAAGPDTREPDVL